MNTSRSFWGLLYFLAATMVVPRVFAAESESVRLSSWIVDRPLWAQGFKDAAWLVARQGPPRGPRIMAFALADTTIANDQKKSAERDEDAIGRLTRTVPLYLSERIFLETTCDAQTAIIVAEGHGPVVSGKEWPLDQLLPSAGTPAPSFILLGKIERRFGGIQNRVEVQLWDVARHQKVRSFSQLGILEIPGVRVNQLSNQVLRHLTSSGICQPAMVDPEFATPQFLALGPYLDGLGQLLDQLLAENKVFPATALYGEASMLAWYRRLIDTDPTLLAPQLIWIRGILANKAYGDDAYKAHLSELFAQLAARRNPTDPIVRLSPVIYAKLGYPAECQDRVKFLAGSSDPAFLDWLHRIDCNDAPHS